MASAIIIKLSTNLFISFDENVINCLLPFRCKNATYLFTFLQKKTSNKFATEDLDQFFFCKKAQKINFIFIFLQRWENLKPLFFSLLYSFPWFERTLVQNQRIWLNFSVTKIVKNINICRYEIYDFPLGNYGWFIKLEKIATQKKYFRSSFDDRFVIKKWFEANANVEMKTNKVINSSWKYFSKCISNKLHFSLSFSNSFSVLTFDNEMIKMNSNFFKRTKSSTYQSSIPNI